MKRWPERFVDTLFEDRTRPLQVISVVAAFWVAWWLLTKETPTNAATARAVFYFLGNETFGVILLTAGILQLVAVAGPWWWLRFLASNIKLMVWGYAMICYWLTVPDSIAICFLGTFFILELWVSSRALHDRDNNGHTPVVA